MGSATTSGQVSAGPVSPRFSGDPGKGSVYYGAALAPGASMTAFEGQVGRVGAHRIFATAGQTASLLSQVHDTVAARRFPVVSIKPVGSWKDIAQGRHNPWVDALLDGLGEVDSPLCFTVNHEPENDVDGGENTAAWHQAMTEFLINRAATRAPRVNVIQILMRWTFAPQSGRHPQDWISDAPTLFGIDGYNLWEPGFDKPWTSLRTLLEPAIEMADGRPLVIGEYGCRTDPDKPGRARRWMTNALDFAAKSNVVAMCYFNVETQVASPFHLDNERRKAFKRCVQDARTVLPAP